MSDVTGAVQVEMRERERRREMMSRVRRNGGLLEVQSRRRRGKELQVTPPRRPSIDERRYKSDSERVSAAETAMLRLCQRQKKEFRLPLEGDRTSSFPKDPPWAS